MWYPMCVDFFLFFWFIVVCELINGDVLNHLNVHQMLRNVIVCGGAYFQLASKYFQADFKSWFPSLAFFVAFFFTLLSFIFCIKYFPLFSLLLFYIPFCFLSPKENTLAHVYTKKPTKWYHIDCFTSCAGLFCLFFEFNLYGKILYMAHEGWNVNNCKVLPTNNANKHLYTQTPHANVEE